MRNLESGIIRSGSHAMEAYYRERASEYDEFYGQRKYQAELAWLRAWVRRHVRGKTVLEVAAGTGYWTGVAARHAKYVVATDRNVETLDIAKSRIFCSNVSFRTSDAFSLPKFRKKFEVGIAFFWWSHIRKDNLDEFLSHFSSRLIPGAKLLLVDEVYKSNRAGDLISRRDRHGNRYELRITSGGAVYEIIKNFPSCLALNRQLSRVCKNVRVNQLEHVWLVSARTVRSSN
jgi:SAM-dependent methyltransferase